MTTALHQALLMINNFKDPLWSFVKVFVPARLDTVELISGNTWTLGGAGFIDTTNQYLNATDPADDDNLAGAAGLAASSGTGDFCLEFTWQRPVITGNEYIALVQAIATGHTVRLYCPSGGATVTTDVSGGGPSGTLPISAGVWYHSAITRSGNNFTHWLEGVAAQTWTNNTLNMSGGVNIWLGSGSFGGSSANVLLRDMRYTIGNPRYTAPFSPPRGALPRG